MNYLKKATLSVGLALSCVAAPAFAETIVLDSGWQPFNFFDDGGPFEPASFDFTLSGPAQFNITDAYINGDQFHIFINGEDKGVTSVPSDDGTNFGTDYNAAFTSPLFSHGSYLLGPGNYSVTGFVEAAATGFGSGSGAVQLSSVVSAAPEPSTWALMLVGFGVAGYAIRKRRTAQTAANLA